MGIEYFLFALMLFGMALIVLFLLFHGKKRSRKAEEKEYAEKEQKLMLLYFEVQDMLDSFKEDVANATERLEWQIRQVEAEAKSIRRAEERIPQNQEQRWEPQKKEAIPEKKEPALHGKVAQLYRDGLTEEKIAEELKISTSEVGFILKLNAG